MLSPGGDLLFSASDDCTIKCARCLSGPPPPCPSPEAGPQCCLQCLLHDAERFPALPLPRSAESAAHRADSVSARCEGTPGASARSRYPSADTDTRAPELRALPGCGQPRPALASAPLNGTITQQALRPRAAATGRRSSPAPPRASCARGSPRSGAAPPSCPAAATRSRTWPSAPTDTSPLRRVPTHHPRWQKTLPASLPSRNPPRPSPSGRPRPRGRKASDAADRPSLLVSWRAARLAGVPGGTHLGVGGAAATLHHAAQGARIPRLHFFRRAPSVAVPNHLPLSPFLSRFLLHLSRLVAGPHRPRQLRQALPPQGHPLLSLPGLLPPRLAGARPRIHLSSLRHHGPRRGAADTARRRRPCPPLSAAGGAGARAGAPPDLRRVGRRGEPPQRRRVPGSHGAAFPGRGLRPAAAGPAQPAEAPAAHGIPRAPPRRPPPFRVPLRLVHLLSGRAAR